MNEIILPWKRITRGLPKARRYADDRAPTLEEIRKITEYPDRRIKAIVTTMVSSGIRLGAWNYLKWNHIIPIKREGKLVAANLSEANLSNVNSDIHDETYADYDAEFDVDLTGSILSQTNFKGARLPYAIIVNPQKFFGILADNETDFSDLLIRLFRA